MTMTGGKNIRFDLLVGARGNTISPDSVAIATTRRSNLVCNH